MIELAPTAVRNAPHGIDLDPQERRLPSESYVLSCVGIAPETSQGGSSASWKAMWLGCTASRILDTCFALPPHTIGGTLLGITP